MFNVHTGIPAATALHYTTASTITSTNTAPMVVYRIQILAFRTRSTEEIDEGHVITTPS